MHLHIWCFHVLAGFQERQHRRRGQAHEAALLEHIAQDLPGWANPLHFLIVGQLGALHVELNAGVDMVAQVFADAHQLVLHLNAVGAQQFRPADARQLQQLWRSHAAGAHDYLFRGVHLDQATVLHVLDAGAFGAIHQHLVGVRPGLNSQVRAVLDRIQITARRAPSHTVADRRLGAHDPLLLGAIIIGVVRNPEFLGGGADGVI